MLTHFFKLTLRRALKNPVFTMINVGGLSMGIATFLLILQYISFEKSVNHFHVNLSSLYRVVMSYENGTLSALSSPGLAPLGQQTIGEIKSYCRMAEGSNLGHGIVAIEGDASKRLSFREDEFAYVDGNFFSLFSFPVSKGDASSLTKPNTVALSQSIAQKYFGTAEPIGKTLTLNNQFGQTTYTVTAIYEDLPENSDLRYPLVFSLQTLASKANLNGNESWANMDGLGPQWMVSFVQLNDGANISMVEGKLEHELQSRKVDEKREIHLQPLPYLHLASSLSDPLPTSGSLEAVYMLMAIAGVIVLIAWFNFINLSTAGALKQGKEVGIRKVSGASRKQLIRQFLGEALLINATSFVIALGLVNIFQGFYNEMVGHNLSLAVFSKNTLWITGLLLLATGCVASGAYTSFVLSGYQPAQVLKGKIVISRDGINLRKVLVVAQFSISVFLIGATIVLHQQLNFLQNKKLGMNIEQLLVIQGAEVGKDDTFKERASAFDHELSQRSFVRTIARTAAVPLQGYNFSTSGITRLVPSPGEENTLYSIMMVDSRYFDTYEMKIAAGQNFTTEMGERKFTEIDRVIINETAARLLGLGTAEEAVNQKIKMSDAEYTILGVIEDYHHESLHKAIDPILFLPNNKGGLFTVKLSSDHVSDHIAEMEQLFKKYFPGNPFSYYFQDDTYQNLYKAELRYSQLFTVASTLAIIISCLGLFGLATFSVEQRAKEIGIRKIVGASVAQINHLFTIDFLKLVAISFVIATPVAWWATHEWIQRFAYKAEIGWWIFAGAGLVAIAVAVIAVSSRAIRAALVNPVDSLRSE